MSVSDLHDAHCRIICLSVGTRHVTVCCVVWGEIDVSFVPIFGLCQKSRSLRVMYLDRNAGFFVHKKTLPTFTHFMGVGEEIFHDLGGYISLLVLSGTRQLSGHFMKHSSHLYYCSSDEGIVSSNSKYTCRTGMETNGQH